MPTLALLAALMLALVVPIAPASAHDAVTGTSPTDGESLGSVPDAIEISFTDTPLSLGSEILVEDAQGRDWTTGEVEITGNSATQPIDPDSPAGEYTVTWRVVSSDSHPIEGAFDFTVAEAAASASPSSTPSSGPSKPAAEPSQATGAQQSTNDEDEPGFPTGFVVTLTVILLLALVIVLMALAPRRHSDAAETR